MRRRQQICGAPGGHCGGDARVRPVKWNTSTGELALQSEVTVNGELAGQPKKVRSCWAEVVDRQVCADGGIEYLCEYQVTAVSRFAPDSTPTPNHLAPHTHTVSVRTQHCMLLLLTAHGLCLCDFQAPDSKGQLQGWHKRKDLQHRVLHQEAFVGVTGDKHHDRYSMCHFSHLEFNELHKRKVFKRTR